MPPSARGGRGVAILLDLDPDGPRKAGANVTLFGAHAEIGRALGEHGFERRQGSVYSGDDTVAAVSCVLAIQDVTRRLPWFGPSARDVRMLRIEENDDLGPAVDSVT